MRRCAAHSDGWAARVLPGGPGGRPRPCSDAVRRRVPQLRAALSRGGPRAPLDAPRRARQLEVACRAFAALSARLVGREINHRIKVGSAQHPTPRSTALDRCRSPGARRVRGDLRLGPAGLHLIRTTPPGDRRQTRVDVPREAPPLPTGAAGSSHTVARPQQAGQESHCNNHTWELQLAGGRRASLLRVVAVLGLTGGLMAARPHPLRGARCRPPSTPSSIRSWPRFHTGCHDEPRRGRRVGKIGRSPPYDGAHGA